jgi:hypothetical protein
MTTSDAVWLALTGLAFTLLLLAGLIRAAARHAPKDAPPAQVPPAPVPAGATSPTMPTLTREQQLCIQRGHVVPDWARTPTHLICARCEQSWPRPVDDFDAHTDQALAIVNSHQEINPDDEVALYDLALWELESGWATS